MDKITIIKEVARLMYISRLEKINAQKQLCQDGKITPKECANNLGYDYTEHWNPANWNS